MKLSLPFLLGAALLLIPRSGDAYITAPVQTLGQLCGSTYVTLVQVEKFSREKGIIVYRKVRDLKGVCPRDQIRHAFDLQNTPQHKGQGDVPVRPDAVDWTYALSWAEVGKTAVVFSLKYDPFGDFGHTYIDKCWYATMCPARDWDFWWSIYSDPALLTRWHCGTPAQLAAAVDQVLAGKTAVVPSLAGGTRDDLRQGRGRIQGLKVGLQIADFNAERDRVPNWTPREIATVLKDLDHADRAIRLQALRDLEFAGTQGKTATARLAALCQAGDVEERMGAVAALAGIDPEHAKIVPAAVTFLKDASSERRLRAAELLVQTPARAKAAGPEVAAAAIPMFEDPTPDVRRRALGLMPRLGAAARPALPSLIQALKDPVRETRIAAAETLGSIGPEAADAVAGLGELVRSDRSGTVRMRAADALGKIGPAAKAAAPALEAALQDPAMAQRAEVLARIRDVLGTLR